MAEVDGVKASLAQTQALERVQESARRHGEMEQQNFAVRLDREVDAREHRVNDGEQPQPEELDAEARKKREEAARRREGAGEEPEAGPAGDGEENLGRHVDVRA